MLAPSSTQATMTAVGDTISKAEKDIYRKKTSPIFFYRFIMNQILFFTYKKRNTNGPRGHARQTKGSTGKIREKIQFQFLKLLYDFYIE